MAAGLGSLPDQSCPFSQSLFDVGLYSTATGDAAALLAAGSGLVCAGVTRQTSHILLTCTSCKGRSNTDSTHRARALNKTWPFCCQIWPASKSGASKPCLAADFFISNTAPFHAMRVGAHFYATPAPSAMQASGLAAGQRSSSGLMLPVTATTPSTTASPANHFHICSSAACMLHGSECCVLQLDGVIDRKVRFSPVLEGLSGPEYMHWMLGPFTDFPVSGSLPCPD